MLNRMSVALLVVLMGSASPGQPAPSTGEKESAAQPKIWLALLPGTSLGSPQPTASPDSPTVLPYGRVQVAKSALSFRIVCVPDDASINIVYKAGPRDYFALFIGGTDEYAERNFTEPFLAFITAKKGASGRPTLLFIPEEVKADTVIPRCTLSIGDAPDPVPDPTDPLTLAIRDAFRSEPAATRTADMAKLASLYRAAAATTVTSEKVDTWETLFTVMQTARKTQIDERLPGVRKVLGDELFDVKWERKPGVKMDAAGRKLAAATLIQAARAVEAVR